MGVGDKVEVYSRSMQKWMSGRVTSACEDGDVVVVYTDGKGSEWEKPVDPADHDCVRRIIQVSVTAFSGGPCRISLPF